jgi:L-malate glycosyltransferase
VKPLLVDLETQWRGGQNQALLLLKGLRARGHEPELVAVTGSDLEERASTGGISVHPVDRFLKPAQAALEIRHLLKSESFDVVHANEPHALTATWLARAHSRAPLIVSRRVGYPLSKSWLARRRYHAAMKIVAISQWSAKQAIDSGAPSSKLTVVHEGVELPRLPSFQARQAARAQWNVPESAALLGCVGVLSPDKGQEWLIRALALVRREFTGCKLLLAGDGPCRAKLEQLAAELGLQDAVLFPGFVKDVESIYSVLDLFLLPSFFEALSNALMSAMAYGIPSIAFNVGGPAEIIEHGVSGLLVEPAKEHALADAIVKMLRDQAFAQRLGQQGRDRIERDFSADQMVQGILSVYEQAWQQYPKK